VKLIAQRFKDQPETPMERAIFWVEYVIRNKGADFMKTSSRHLNFIQYQNLDVYLVFLLTAFLAISIPIFIICKILKCLKGIFGSKQKEE
jgi:hypothetical protein